MKAIVLKRFGDAGNLAIEEIPAPEPGAGEVLVRVKALGINQIDLKTRRGEGMAGALRREQPMILGWDIAGIVEATGDEAGAFQPGDAVFGTVRFPGLGHAYAEYVAAPAGQLAPKPENISFAEAAAASQSPLTAWQALFDAGAVGPGDRVLIHGGAGGVGHFAVQLAHHAGCYVVATASGTDAAFVHSLGANEVIDYKTQRFDDLLHDMDFVLDPIGGENFIRSLRVLRPGGRIVLLPSDRKAEADRAAAERGIGGYRHIMMHADGNEMRRIACLLAEDHVRTHLDRIFRFEEMPQAHEHLEKGKVRGKIAVVVE